MTGSRTRSTGTRMRSTSLRPIRCWHYWSPRARAATWSWWSAAPVVRSWSWRAWWSSWSVPLSAQSCATARRTGPVGCWAGQPHHGATPPRRGARRSRWPRSVQTQLGRVPVRSVAIGEVRRTRHRTTVRPRRRASPKCSVSAGLHPSPGTVHPRQHKAGEGGLAQHRYWRRCGANRRWTTINIGSISPGQRVNRVLHLCKLPVQRYFLANFTAISPGQMVLVFHTEAREFAGQ